MSDEQAFAVLIRLMSQYGFRNLFSIQMETLHERLYQFDHIMQQKIPELHRHLEVQGVEPGLYATQWFMTVFAYKCSLNLVFRVLDVLFTDGPYIVLHFALALLHRNQHTLLNMEHDDLVDFLNNGIFDSYQVSSLNVILKTIIINNGLFKKKRTMKAFLSRTLTTSTSLRVYLRVWQSSMRRKLLGKLNHIPRKNICVGLTQIYPNMYAGLRNHTIRSK